MATPDEIEIAVETYNAVARPVLRDLFAMVTLLKLVERWGPAAITDSAEIARRAYHMADAMIAARKAKP